jgi:hypothetical protein
VACLFLQGIGTNVMITEAATDSLRKTRKDQWQQKATSSVGTATELPAS